MLVLSSHAGASQEPHAGGRESIRLVVLDRPPYYAIHDGKPSGFLLLRAKRFIEAAGFLIDGYETCPRRRILAMIGKNDGRLCSVGWFRTAERERYARDSQPIHVDRLRIVVAHADAWSAAIAREPRTIRC